MLLKELGQLGFVSMFGVHLALTTDDSVIVFHGHGATGERATDSRMSQSSDKSGTHAVAVSKESSWS